MSHFPSHFYSTPQCTAISASVIAMTFPSVSCEWNQTIYIHLYLSSFTSHYVCETLHVVVYRSSAFFKLYECAIVYLFILLLIDKQSTDRLFSISGHDEFCCCTSMFAFLWDCQDTAQSSFPGW